MFVGLANNFQLEKVPPALCFGGQPKIEHLHNKDKPSTFDFPIQPNQVFVITGITWTCISKVVKFVNYGPPVSPHLTFAGKRIHLDPTLPPPPGSPLPKLNCKAFDPPIAMSYTDRTCVIESPHFFNLTLTYSGYLFTSTGKPINKLKCIAFTMFDQNTQGLSILADGKLDELRTSLLDNLGFDMDTFPWEALGSMPEAFQHGISNLMMQRQEQSMLALEQKKRVSLPGGSVSDFISDCTQLENLPWDPKLIKELAHHMTTLGWKK